MSAQKRQLLKGAGLVCGRRALADEPGRGCRPKEEANRAANEALTRLDLQVNSLRNGDDTSAALSAIESLRAGPCLAWSAEDSRPLKTRSALALRTYWQKGGFAWLRTYLETVGSWFTMGAPHRPKRPTEAEFRSVASVAPDMLPAASLEEPLGLPEAILCAAADDGCGSGETRGWRVRAEQALGDWKVSGDELAALVAENEYEPESCWARARRRPLAKRYSVWRICIEVNAKRSVTLPLGEFRSPTSGWWVLRTQRGREEQDEMRAYDVATGAAYVARRPDERDARATVRLGRVPVAALREALWMAALSTAVVHAQTDLEWHAVPAGLVPRLVVRPPPALFTDLGVAGGSDQAPLTWRWVEGTRIAQGELEWPWSGRPAQDYAVRLLAAVEATFVEGCAPAPLPSTVLALDEPQVGAEVALQLDSERELARALSEVADSRVCPSSAP